jgi:hypothetical protein
MGAFDKLAQLKEQPFAQNGGTFQIESAEYQGREKTQFGEQHVAHVLVKMPNGETDTFVVYGVMAQQVQRQESGDFPRECRIVQDGNANVIKPASEGF